MTAGNQYSIKDLEVLSGIKAHTIRIWEKRYQLFDPQRTLTNIRFYSCDELKKLLNISMLLDKGHKVSKLSAMSMDDLNDVISQTFIKSNTDKDFYASQINSLVIAMLELDENLFEKTFSGCVLRYGLENTIMQVIYPFLHKVGMMWCVNEAMPAQEHFSSNLIRQKLLAAIDGLLPSSKTDKAHTYLLFLPVNEDHELSLLLAHYLLKKDGNKVFYLGANVPYSDLEEVSQIAKPGNLLTFLMTPRNLADVNNYIANLASSFPDLRILISGNEQLLNQAEIAEPVVRLKEISDLQKLLF